MPKTKIEWCDLSINPVKGLCPVACPYCYARRMYKRFRWDEAIRLDTKVLFGLPEEHRRIFVGSTMELFGEWVPGSWMKTIFMLCSKWPQHTFIFLTKEPLNLKKWSPFPSNCYVGASVTNQKQYMSAIVGLCVIEATVKFISFEPLLEEIITSHAYSFEDAIQWVIIGQQSPVGLNTVPALSWVKNIVREADIYSIPVFLKDNLKEGFLYKHVSGKDNTWALAKTDLYKGNLFRQEHPMVMQVSK